MSKERSEAILRSLARSGKDDAQYILNLREACARIIETTNGIDLALGIDPDADDVLNGAMDDAYGDLLPTFIKRAGSFDRLYWHVDPRTLLEAKALDYKRFNGKLPAKLGIHSSWRNALKNATTIDVNGSTITIEYLRTLKDEKPSVTMDRMMIIATGEEE
jgi:hypothetical protein